MRRGSKSANCIAEFNSVLPTSTQVIQLLDSGIVGLSGLVDDQSIRDRTVKFRGNLNEAITVEGAAQVDTGATRMRLGSGFSSLEKLSSWDQKIGAPPIH